MENEQKMKGSRAKGSCCLVNLFKFYTLLAMGFSLG